MKRTNTPQLTVDVSCQLLGSFAALPAQLVGIQRRPTTQLALPGVDAIGRSHYSRETCTTSRGDFLGRPTHKPRGNLSTPCAKEYSNSPILTKQNIPNLLALVCGAQPIHHFSTCFKCTNDCSVARYEHKPLSRTNRRQHTNNKAQHVRNPKTQMLDSN